MLITWDEPKRLTNIAKHGYDFAALDYGFFLASAVVPASLGRQMAIGHFEGKTIAVVFSYLGAEGLSVISMRKAGRNERTVLK